MDRKTARNKSIRITLLGRISGKAKNIFLYPNYMHVGQKCTRPFFYLKPVKSLIVTGMGSGKRVDKPDRKAQNRTRERLMDKEGSMWVSSNRRWGACIEAYWLSSFSALCCWARYCCSPFWPIHNWCGKVFNKPLEWYLNLLWSCMTLWVCSIFL